MQALPPPRRRPTASWKRARRMCSLQMAWAHSTTKMTLIKPLLPFLQCSLPATTLEREVVPQVKEKKRIKPLLRPALSSIPVNQNSTASSLLDFWERSHQMLNPLLSEKDFGVKWNLTLNPQLGQNQEITDLNSKVQSPPSFYCRTERTRLEKDWAARPWKRWRKLRRRVKDESKR